MRRYKRFINSNPLFIPFFILLFFIKIVVMFISTGMEKIIQIVELCVLLPYDLINKVVNFNKIAEMRSRKRNNDVLVVGNGPSLNSIDFAKVRDDIDVIVMNGFYKHPKSNEINPNFYIFYDKNIFEDIPAVRNFHNELKDKEISSFFMLPKNTAPHFYKTNRILQPSSYLYYTAAKRHSLFSGFEFSIYKFPSSSCLAIWLALNLKYKRIYLAGFDHNYLANREQQDHFYKGPTIEGHYLNVPDKDRLPYLTEMQANLEMFKVYEKQRMYSEKRGIRIRNLNNQSYLDTFGYTSVKDIYKCD